MTVSYENSKVIFQGIKAAGITSLSALPETWLGLLLQQAEKDPDVTLIQVAKEEEAIGIAARRVFRRRAARPADAEPRVSRRDQRHRVAGAALRHLRCAC